MFSRSRSVTSRRNREFSSSSLAIRSSPLPVRLRPSASLRHRCKVTTLTPSVRAISLCGFPCLAKSFACASFVATSTLECRFGLAIACPAAVTSISFTEQPRQLQFFGQACTFVDKLSDKLRCDLRVNEYTAQLRHTPCISQPANARGWVQKLRVVSAD